ncbi:MAG: hypothetical protein NZ482_05045 [Gloeomargarita sp. SKYG98]|nr:hypothetical protein [Gloeomargarita sp. SKYG98]
MSKNWKKTRRFRLSTFNLLVKRLIELEKISGLGLSTLLELVEETKQIREAGKRDLQRKQVYMALGAYIEHCCKQGKISVIDYLGEQKWEEVRTYLEQPSAEVIEGIAEQVVALVKRVEPEDSKIPQYSLRDLIYHPKVLEKLHQIRDWHIQEKVALFAEVGVHISTRQLGAYLRELRKRGHDV